MPKTFSKTPISYQDLLQKMRTEGLVITAPDAAIKHLKQISYYRLKGYALAFRQHGTPVIA